MDGHQKTRLVCSYGEDEPYVSKSSTKREYAKDIPADLAPVQMTDSGCGYRHGDSVCSISSMYDDCLSILGGAFEDPQSGGGDSPTQSLVLCSESAFSCIHSEAECLDLIEGTRRGSVARVRRRLNEREKSMIRPGSVFIYKEQESGIRRWTDKREWAPSRVLGAFLAYRDLNGPLYKKTFSKLISSEKYHVVIYTSHEWERSGACCAIFGKSMVDKGCIRECPFQRHCSIFPSNSSESGTDIFGFDIDPRPFAGARSIANMCRVGQSMLQDIEERSSQAETIKSPSPDAPEQGRQHYRMHL